MTFTLRAATDADAEAIAMVWHDGWADGHLGHVPEQLLAHRRLADLRRLVPARVATTTVALAGTQVVGFVTIHDDEVDQLYVTRSARGTGVAATLLSHAEIAIATQYPVAWLVVVAGNVRARRFYERQGWSDAGPVDYHAPIEGGTLVVPMRRYEKRVRSDAGRHPPIG